MTTLYFDCFAGAAGDMILGALIDAGVPFDEVQRALGSLAVDGFSVSAERVMKAGVSSLKFRVHETPAPGAEEASGHRHYHLKHIYAAIDRSALSAAGRARATRMFQRLAEAEAAIHGSTMEKVHLHEVGAVDSIIDIVGTVFAMEHLAAGQVVVSPVNVGGGMVKTAHGVFPVPAPATVRLLGDAPSYSSGVQMETLTPTGALILTEYATSYGPMPAMRVSRVGYGAGDRELPETPNVVRVFVGEADRGAAAMRVAVLACEIDDMNPQIFGAVMDRLYAAGALEVFYQPVQMKKNRPGTLMTIVCAPERRDALAALVFRETTTIGIRHQEMARLCLDREMVPVETAYGVVRFKIARLDGAVLNAQPEFDDLAQLAADRDVPIKMVQAAAQKAWLDSRQ
ncbi:MAG: nickel pincer cofactor biosynthesis protein LarC [Acidobacteria bacterium]|nr:nickel pincer cofactor biosynthesis protein LarC [Acidobacteriota bacterium]